MSTVQVNPGIVFTTLILGGPDVRWWGACDQCGHVDEVTEERAKTWPGKCAVCIDELPFEPFNPMRLYGVPRVG